MIRKPRVVTFRLDEATWDWMRKLAPYTKYGNTSSEPAATTVTFIAESTAITRL